MGCTGYISCYSVLVYDITYDTWTLQRTVNLGSKKTNGRLPLCVVAFSFRFTVATSIKQTKPAKDSVNELLVSDNFGNCTHIYICL